MLNERSQTQKTTYFIILFVRNVQNRQNHKDREYRLVVAKGWEEGEWGVSWVKGFFLG